MNLSTNRIEKICNFYVSDWHMAVMIVPYIHQELNSGKKVATIFENTMKENIQILLEKLNLKNAQEIKRMDWTSKPELETEELQDIMQTEKTEIVFIINGTETYIKQCGNTIEEYYTKNHIQKKIKIVNCYEMTSIDGNISKVLEQHNKLLNTKGERAVSEILETKEQTV